MIITNIQLGTTTAPGSPFTADRYINSGPFKLTFTGTAISGIETSGTGIKITDGRLQNDKGANIVAANDLTLGTDGNIFTVTGNTTINAITSTNWQSGSFIIIETTGTPLFKNNTTGGAGTLPMKLAGSSDFQSAADDAILFYNNGSFWHELARKQAGQGGRYTFRNALSEYSGNIVELGSSTGGTSDKPLLHDTFINTNAFTLTIGTSTTEVLKVNSTTVGNVVTVTNSGNGNGLFALTQGGIALLGQSTYSSTTAIEEVLRLNRFSSGGAGGVGLGSKIVMNLEASNSSSQNACSFGVKWTNATITAQTSQIVIAVVTDADIHNGFLIGGPQSTLLSRDAATNETAERFSVAGTYKALTDSTATAFVRVNIPSGTVTGGEILITVQANDATDYQARTLRFIWAAVNKAGTLTVTIQTAEEAVAVSAGTLTVAIDYNDAGSGNLDFRANAASSLTETILRCSYQVFKNIGAGVITPQ